MTSLTVPSSLLCRINPQAHKSGARGLRNRSSSLQARTCASKKPCSCSRGARSVASPSLLPVFRRLTLSTLFSGHRSSSKNALVSCSLWFRMHPPRHRVFQGSDDSACELSFFPSLLTLHALRQLTLIPSQAPKQSLLSVCSCLGASIGTSLGQAGSNDASKLTSLVPLHRRRYRRSSLHLYTSSSNARSSRSSKRYSALFSS